MFQLARCGCRFHDGAQGDDRRFETPLCLRPFVLRIANFAALCALFFVGGLEISRAQVSDSERAVYARAVEFCRGQVKRPMALDLDRRVLCFDGAILPASDFSSARALEPNGLFVVRSPGGEAPTAIAMANFIRDRRATVVVYDYCFSACASYLLVASDETFVMKDTLVAWHHTTAPLCPSLEASKDGGPKRLQKAACSDTPTSYQAAYREFRDQNEEFYASRVVDPLFEAPPQSFTIRRILRSMFEGTGSYPNVIWTWNPRYSAGTFKTKIVYQAYPGSQAEVDDLVSKLRLRYRVLYDP